METNAYISDVSEDVLSVKLKYYNNAWWIDGDITIEDIIEARRNHKTVFAVIDTEYVGDVTGMVIPLKHVDEANNSIYFESAISDGNNVPPAIRFMRVRIYYQNSSTRISVTDVAYNYAPLNRALPVVDTSDNGKILKVVDGAWEAVTP